MRQKSEETARTMITMEEYLKKRQAITAEESVDCENEKLSAWKLAELLYV
nr:hypothetical protein [uncultured Mediterraneibacter sp.]